MAQLCVNIDHVATVRQARRIEEPDPVAAAVLCELAGASGITVHLREDRRHIQDRDVEVLARTVRVPLNLEMAATEAMVALAHRIAPQQVTLVPEGRQEITTEGGLDVLGHRESIERAVDALQGEGIRVSLFIDPTPESVRASSDIGAQAIELHTGDYAEACYIHREDEAEREATRLELAAGVARTEFGLIVHAGHGLNYRNVRRVARIAEVSDLNIGHAIVAQAILVGLDRAVRDMIALIESVRRPQ